MNVLLKSKNIPIWSVTLVALGIHGLILAIPIALEEPAQEKPKSAPVKMQKLPPSKVSVLPKPKSSPLGATVPPLSNSSISTGLQPIFSTAQQPASQPNTQTQPTTQTQTATPPQPTTQTQIATPPQPTTPSQPPTPAATPENVSDFFQIAGAVACTNTKDCYSTDNTTGVSVADQVIANLNKQGYNTKERADLTSDYPMKIYEVRKDPKKPVEYLHIIWGNGTGTRTLKLTKMVNNWSELAAIAQL